MVENRIIPISQIERYYDIKIQSPPPYRSQLGIKEDVLVSALKTLKLRDTPIRINYFRNEPIVSVAPDGNGEISAVTHAIATEQKKQKSPSLITVDFSGNVVLRLPYTDKETATPEKTADHSSKMLQRAFQRIPTILYINEIIDSDDGETDASIEFKLFSTITVFHIVAATIGGAYFKLLFEQDVSLTYGEWFLLSGALSYTLATLIFLDKARKYKQTAGKDHPNEIPGPYFSENPRRAFYPVKFVEELIVPSTLYFFQRMNEKNIIVPLPTSTNSH